MMAFGTYDAVVLNKQKKPAPPKTTQHKVPDVPEKTNGSVMEISILLVGRTIAALSDFIAGLHTNMSPAASKAGLAFYSENSGSISDILQKQKQLSALFANGDIGYKLCDNIDTDSSSAKMYSLSLGMAGIRSFSFKVNFFCATATRVLAGNLPDCNIVWLLADAPFYYENTGDPDSYISASATIAAAARKSSLPVYLLAGHIERLGKIRDEDSLCSIEPDVCSDISKCIKKHLGDAVSSCPILPVQIYGGLTYRETDPDGSLIFEENRFGGLSTYKPAACHIPLMYSLELLNAGAQINNNDIINRIKQLNRVQRTTYYSAEN